jgi:hypothetical protein
MPRPVLAAAASVAIGLLAAPGLAGAQVPMEDSVTGTAGTGAGRSFVEFTFDARSGPSGENPTGTVRFDAFLADLGFLEVSCLTVSGNRASMILLIPPLSPSAPEGVLVSVQDNDGAGEDGLEWSFLEVLPADCPVPSEVANPVASGDLTVTDARPLPTSKDQCKNGGWRSYGVFKSQGDCVSFVSTEGRNTPL